MPYLQTVVRAGKTVEIHKYFAPRYGRKGGRAPKVKPTSEAMRKINLEHAVKKLTWTLNENFSGKDIHLVLTYGQFVPEPKEARRFLDSFKKQARKLLRKQGEEFRYVEVTEYKNKRIHHHIVMNGLSAAVLQQLWPYGRPRITPLDGNGQYSKLAEYLVKETDKTFRSADAPSRKRWNSSKNLRPPKITTVVIESKRWKEQPRPWKGYYLEGGRAENRVNEYNGTPMQFYRMIQNDLEAAGRSYCHGIKTNRERGATDLIRVGAAVFR